MNQQRALYSLVVIITIAFSGCISTPDNYLFGGRMVGTVSILKAGCESPFVLEQDCSGMSGGTRKIDYDGMRLRIAGSSDGTTVFFMAESKWTLDTRALKRTLETLEQDYRDRGIHTLEVIAVAGNGELAGLYMVFDTPIYDELKTLTIED